MNKISKCIIILCILITTTACAGATNKLPVPINHANTVNAVGTITVCFSPNGEAQQTIINEIDNAKSSIYVQAYSFTNTYIGNALVNAKKRGVDVKCIADQSQEKGKYSLCKVMLQNNIPMKIDSEFAIAHSKIMIIDNQTIITGSYNFSSGAEHKNAENMLVIKGDSDLVQLYLDNFNWRWDNTNDYQ